MPTFASSASCSAKILMLLRLISAKIESKGSTQGIVSMSNNQGNFSFKVEGLESLVDEVKQLLNFEQLIDLAQKLEEKQQSGEMRTSVNVTSRPLTSIPRRGNIPRSPATASGGDRRLSWWIGRYASTVTRFGRDTSKATRHLSKTWTRANQRSFASGCIRDWQNSHSAIACQCIRCKLHRNRGARNH